MAILAHRGLTATARDNSHLAIEGVATANRTGTPVGIEVDIRCTLDALVMNHDPHYESAVLAVNDLAQLTGIHGEQDLITLDAALRAATDISIVNLEVKEPAAADKTLEAVRRHCGAVGQPVEKFVLSSFVPWIVRHFVEEAREFGIGCLVDSHLPAEDFGPEHVLKRLNSRDDTLEPATQWALEVFDWTGADYLHIHWSHVCPRLFEEMDRRGKQVSFWTVDDERLMMELALRPQTSNIVTNFPHIVFPELTPTNGHRKDKKPKQLYFDASA